jgi:hypothetical protein
MHNKGASQRRKFPKIIIRNDKMINFKIVKNREPAKITNIASLILCGYSH